MNKSDKQLQIINQSMEDAKEIINFKVSVTGIKKILFIWVILYTSYNVLISTLQKLNLYHEWYLTEWYYHSYNIFISLINVLMGIVLVIGIHKINMSLKERRFLKVWVVFPVLLLISNVILSITPYLNLDIMLQYYNAFPLSIILHSLSVLFIYSYCRQTRVLGVFRGLSVYSLLLFLFMITNNLVTEYSEWYTALYIFVENISAYKVVEILTTLLVIIFIKEEKR